MVRRRLCGATIYVIIHHARRSIRVYSGGPPTQLTHTATESYFSNQLGAGKSTLLRALADGGTVADGIWRSDERAAVGMFAQDIVQPMLMNVLYSYSSINIIRRPHVRAGEYIVLSAL